MEFRRAIIAFMAAFAAAVALAAGTNGLDVARQALRDGLWEVARSHAAAESGDEAKLIILESYASENRWEDVERSLESWGEGARTKPFDYYRAVIAGRLDEAVKLLKAGGSRAGYAEAMMMEADLQVKRGARREAERMWREVVAMTNAGARAVAVAAMNLGDVAALRVSCNRVDSPLLRRAVGLRLGRELLKAKETAEEGEKLIRRIVRDSPDADGARDAFLALAVAEGRDGRWKEADKTYHDLIETWPEAARIAAVQEGRGMAYMKLGRAEEAVEAFAKAEALAKDDALRARSVLKQGDALTELGRNGEAMAKYRLVIDKYPQTAVAEKLRRFVEIRELETSGRGFYRDFRFEEAMRTFAAVAKADESRRPRMAYFEVLCLYGLGRDDEAVRKAEALAKSSKDASIRAESTLWLAKVMYNRGEWKRAVALFGTFAETSPTHAETPNAMLWQSRAAFAGGEFAEAIQLATKVVERFSDTPVAFAALLVQGEALIGLSRFDEAVLVLERIAVAEKATNDDRQRARLLKADALFATGADNPARYPAALEAYRAISFAGVGTASEGLVVAFKIARVLEKLKRREEAVDQYYVRVILAYRDGRQRGVRYDDEARAAFSRAVFRLADEFESRGRDLQAIGVLRLAAESDVPISEEAERRIERISTKGRFL